MQNKQLHTFKYLMLLGMLFVIMNIAADILAYKMITIGPFLMSIGVFIVPVAYACSDVVAEVYGYAISRQIIWYGLAMELLFDLICYYSTFFSSPKYIRFDHAYYKVLHPLPHVYFAVLIANLLSDFLNVYFISKWKIMS